MNKRIVIILSSLIGIIFFITFFIFGKDTVYFSLNGLTSINVNIGDEYNEEGFNSKYCINSLKLFCKNINDNVKITKVYYSNFDEEVITYTLDYNGFNKTLTRKIIFKDLESPTIELVNNNISICPNEVYIEEGYKAFDNVDGDITDKVETNRIDNKIYYSVTDSSNNKKIVYRNINYKDSEKPTIELLGKKNIYLFLNQQYYEYGYKSTDNCDGSITDNVTISSNIDSSKEGQYQVEYNIQDSSGNKNTATRNVIVYKDTSDIPKNGKYVYLTFDDGPCQYTEDIINILNKYNVKATFFVTNQFSNYSYLIKKEYDSGHTVAVHTFSHNYDHIYSSLDNYISDFNEMNSVIYEQTGEYSNIFRFPGGSSNTISRFNRKIVSKIAERMTEMGYHYFDWNVDSNDTGTTDPDVIFNNVINEIRKNENSVVLMHDIKKYNIESVEKIINYGLNNGFTFLGLEENSVVVHHKINN